MSSAKIKALYIFADKGVEGESKNAVRTAENGGIEGDMYCQQVKRQISISTTELIEWMDAQELQGLCFRRFRANIVVKGLGEKLCVGTLIKVGKVTLRISEAGKSCFESCERYQENMDCKLRDGCYFAESLSEGDISLGDEIEVLPGTEAYNWKRYERQMFIPGIGKEEQEKIQKASVLVVGAGGLGCPVLTALSEAGIGHIGIVDGDTIEESNLNRQYFYTPGDVGKSKAWCAGEWVKRFRPDCVVDVFEERLTLQNGPDMMKRFDIIIAAVDNMDTRLLINRLTQQLGKPFIDGAIDGFYGTVTAVLDADSPCLACLNPHGIQPKHISSSLGTTTMMIGALEAQYALLYAAEIPFYCGSILSYDGIHGTIDEIPAVKNPKCEVCEKRDNL